MKVDGFRVEPGLGRLNSEKCTFIFVRRPEMETWPKTEGCLQDPQLLQEGMSPSPLGSVGAILTSLVRMFSKSMLSRGIKSPTQKTSSNFFLPMSTNCEAEEPTLFNYTLAQISANFPFLARQNC